MQVLKVVSAACLAAVMSGIPVGAQPLSQVNGPKELPPAAFTGNQYVDSAGCVFIRAGVGSQTTWVPRVSRDRKLVCGYEPTFPPGLLDGVEALKNPAPESTTPAPAPAPDAPTPEAVAAAPALIPAPTPAAVVPAAKAQVAPAPTRGAGPSVRLVHVRPVGKAATYCLSNIDQAQRYLLSDGRRVTRCGGAGTEAPVAYLNGLGMPGLLVAEGSPDPAEVRRALRADQGNHRVIWSNGPIANSVAAPAMSTKRPVPAGAGGYVQVGVYADPANAARAIARLKALGLPVASSMSRKGGKPIKAVLAGPFATAADLQSALAVARRNGYRDAFARG
ncbi:SPOR domain-containing protein [Defluviimonas sp. SAOS-178_SWC]|uniref:SPOR domain-containing protein n=1 Tax=Defluviimonas sp. SAOS-178_SWC TaxID=3121287 RepID=UPI003221BD8B